MAARGEVRVTVSFGPTSSPVLAHAVSYAIEHAWRTEELRSGAWEATFRIGSDERDFGKLRHFLSMVQGWRTTRVEVNGSTEYRQTVISMLSCAREWLRSKGRPRASDAVARGVALRSGPAHPIARPVQRLVGGVRLDFAPTVS